MPKYIVQSAGTSTCPQCGRRDVRLLIRDDGTIRYNHPAFYLCSCGYIGQVGVGPVESETATKKETT